MGNGVTRVPQNLHIPPPPSPCPSSAASLPAAAGASLNSSQQIPAGRGTPRQIPNLPAASMECFFSPRNSWQQAKGARPYRGRCVRASPVPGVPGVPGRSREAPRRGRNGRGRPGRAVPRSLVQLTAAAAFKFWSEGNRKPQSFSPEPPAPTPAHELASLAKRREWDFSRIRRKPGASRIAEVPAGSCWRCWVSCYSVFCTVSAVK